MSDCFIKINIADIRNQRIVKKIDKYFNFFTLKGCMHLSGENFNNINNVRIAKLTIWLDPKI